ncbi:MAG: glycosyltransferase [Clostridiales bacterium]|nr:glycosyltransferase [Clostridiales bacterium]
MKTISVCMIMKNESKTLSRVLDCVKQFADEIIVVDTGSSDNSKEIAKTYATKVLDFKWDNNFSNARNFSFKQATCDYQMWLDADDFITKQNIEKIKQLKKLPLADVFMFKYRMENLVFYRERILNRAKNFQWKGFVHEAIEAQGNIVYTDIEIEHRKELVQDPKRNLKLYQNAIKIGTPLSPRDTYYYGRELFYNKQISKAIQIFKKFLKYENTYAADNLGAYLMLSECLKKQEKLKKAFDVLLEALKKHNPSAELCCKIGYLAEKLNKDCICWFKFALNCHPQTQGFVDSTYEDLVPLLELSRLLYQTDFQQAKKYHQRAKKLYPNHKSIIYNEQYFK